MNKKVSEIAHLALARMVLATGRPKGRIYAQSWVALKISKALRKWESEKLYSITESIADVAVRLGVSQEQLSHYFKSVKGTRFSYYRRHLRMAEAARLLKTEQHLSIKQISLLTGYSDKRNFRRDFANEFGCTPSEYRDKR